ncbi:MAG: AraC family transcriptional regulator [Bdellovibrionales bacterium]|nr:AraC family transcriptional regulator [Bdellovibrionales bacterium]
MDLLQDVLQQCGLKSSFLGYRKFAAATTVKFPCNKSIGFHVVTQGVAYMHLGGKSRPIELGSGDIAFAARGQDHWISTDPVIHSKVLSLGDFEKRKNGVASPRLTLVSGAYQVWNDPVHPLFSQLPDVFLMKASSMQSFDQLHSLIAMLAVEANSDRLGSDRVLRNVLDILFTLIFRKVIEQSSSKPETWSHALLDDQIKKSVELMHAKWAKPWTLQSLAKELGMSRAGFALKFRKGMGDTPVQYLTKLRMQKAMELLSGTSDSVEVVASAVGYQDAFGFSKAFKKITGMPPREFRKRDFQERESPGRLS